MNVTMKMLKMVVKTILKVVRNNMVTVAIMTSLQWLHRCGQNSRCGW